MSNNSAYQEGLHWPWYLDAFDLWTPLLETTWFITITTPLIYTIEGQISFRNFAKKKFWNLLTKQKFILQNDFSTFWFT